MNWYVKFRSGHIHGPYASHSDALEMSTRIYSGYLLKLGPGLVFSEAIFDQEEVLDELGTLLKRAIDTIVLLSAKKVVTGTIEGGVLSLDEVPDGVTVDIGIDR